MDIVQCSQTWVWEGWLIFISEVSGSDEDKDEDEENWHYSFIDFPLLSRRPSSSYRHIGHPDFKLPNESHSSKVILKLYICSNMIDALNNLRII